MPAVALVAQGLWAVLLALPVTVDDRPGDGRSTYGNLYNQLLEYIIPVDLTFYTLMVGAVVVLRIKAPGGRSALPDVRLSGARPDLYIGRGRSSWCSTSSTSSRGPRGSAT